MITIVADQEILEIGAMCSGNDFYVGFWGRTLGLCIQHDAGTVRVICADEIGLVASHSLKSDENVGLHMF